MLIPDLKKILKPTWLHRPGEEVYKDSWKKHDIREQATIPNDPKILEKLRIKKGDKVLSIASYYATWASALVNNDVIVDYNDISKEMVDYVKKRKKCRFNRYICLNYELLPKKQKLYDWTFTFEACGGKQGLPVAMLRSLLNRKGGIMVLYHKLGGHMGSKWGTYPKIVRTLAKVYGTDYKIKDAKIKSRDKFGKNGLLAHKVFILLTNEKARKLAITDLANLQKNKFSQESLKRLSKISTLINKEFLKEFI